MTTAIQSLKAAYPWIKTPLVISAPMRLIALARMATEVTRAGKQARYSILADVRLTASLGGIGFLAAGTDVSNLKANLEEARSLLHSKPSSGHKDKSSTLPIGVGFINWGVSLHVVLPILREYQPAAVWFFAPQSLESLKDWTEGVRRETHGATKIWVQVGSVKDAADVTRMCKPEVLICQGNDAGGHGLAKGCSVTVLLPEIQDTLEELSRDEGIDMPVLVAAGGIAEARGCAAALAVGASGIVMGTRFLASDEAEIMNGYKQAVLGAGDGGQNTVRSRVYDILRGTNQWPSTYNGRGVINKTYLEATEGKVPEEEAKKLYDEAVRAGDAGWGTDGKWHEGRMTTYAGTGVGLVTRIMPSAEIVEEVRSGARRILEGMQSGI